MTGRTEKDLRRESIPAPGSSSLRCATAGVGRGLVTELRVQRTDSRRGLLLAVRRQLKRLECGTAATRGVCQRSPGPTIEAKLHHLEHLKGGVTPPLQSLLCELAPASTSLTLDVGWLLSPALQRARRSRLRFSAPVAAAEYQTVPAQNSLEELPRVRGQRGRPIGDTQRPRSGAVTRGVTPHLRSGAPEGRRYPTPSCPRPRAVAGRSNPTPEAMGGGRRTNSSSKEPWMCGRRRA